MEFAYFRGGEIIGGGFWGGDIIKSRFALLGGGVKYVGAELLHCGVSLWWREITDFFIALETSHRKWTFFYLFIRLLFSSALPTLGDIRGKDSRGSY